jgi:hypothetical protein
MEPINKSKGMKCRFCIGWMSAFPLLLWLLAITACSHKSADFKAMEQEKDSLLLEEQKKMAEMNQMISVVNLIEDNLDQIKQSENYITFQANQEVIAQDSLGQIINDIELIRRIMVENKAQLAELKARLAISRTTTGELKRLIARLTTKIEEQAATISQLQEQLALKDIRIQELDELVITLSDSITTLQDTIYGKNKLISKANDQLNKVWFVFGTKKELREQAIFTRNGLLDEGFNKDYFLEADARSLTEIPLYSKKAKLLTNHPSSSYQLEKDNDYLVLHILDPEKFWEISKYLVVEVE